MTWCGPLAGQRHLGTGVEDLGGEAHEQIHAYGELAALGFREAGYFAQWTRAGAMSLLAARWSAVASVASALLEHDTLTGHEVRRIVADIEEPGVSTRSRCAQVAPSSLWLDDPAQSEPHRLDALAGCLGATALDYGVVLGRTPHHGRANIRPEDGYHVFGRFVNSP
jgi:hypothetical protein